MPWALPRCWPSKACWRCWRPSYSLLGEEKHLGVLQPRLELAGMAPAALIRSDGGAPYGGHATCCWEKRSI